MENIPKTKIGETEIVEIFSDIEYDLKFVERLISYYSKKLKEILDFFNLDCFRKVRINLFETRELYYDCFSKVMQISKYGIGNCYNGEINYVCSKQDLESIPKAGYIIASIVHELVHLICYEKVMKNKSVWLEEGLAQYLSGQKSFLEMEDKRYKEWLKINVLDKEIPKIEYLKEHGSTYGKFCDLDTNKYNGYDVSYALIRCLVKNFTKQEINEVIRDKNKLAILEKNIIQLFLNEQKEEDV